MHGIVGMESFELMDCDEVHQIVKMFNDRCTGNNVSKKIGFTVQKKLKGLLYWYHDATRRGITIDAADFTAAALIKALKDMKVDATAKDTEVEIEVGTIEIEMEWWK